VFQGPHEEEGAIFETLHQLIDCTLGDDGNDGPFTWYSSLSHSSAIKLHHFPGQKCRFRLGLLPETTMTEWSYHGASSGSIVFDAMVETNKPLLATVYCFSQLLYNFTTWRKSRENAVILREERPGWGQRRDLLAFRSAERLYSRQWRKPISLYFMQFADLVFWYRRSQRWRAKMGVYGEFCQLKWQCWRVLLVVPPVDGLYFTRWQRSTNICMVIFSVSVRRNRRSQLMRKCCHFEW